MLVINSKRKSKAEPHFIGPFVVDQINDVSFELRDEATGAVEKKISKRLVKPFHQLKQVFKHEFADIISVALLLRSPISSHRN